MDEIKVALFKQKMAEYRDLKKAGTLKSILPPSSLMSGREKAARDDLKVSLDLQNNRVRYSKGFSRLKEYAAGYKLSAQQAIIAKCCECMGFYADGLRDCENFICPMYGFMPYGEHAKNGSRKIKSLI